MPIVDTLRLKTRLSDSGMPETQAQAIVEELDEALTTAVTVQVATKVEVVELRAAIHGVGERLEQVVEQVDRRFEEVDRRFEQVDRRFEQMDKRFEQVDKRFERVDKRFEEVDKRFEQVDKRLADLKADVAAVKSDVTLVRWMVGTLVVLQIGILVKLLLN